VFVSLKTGKEKAGGEEKPDGRGEEGAVR